MNVHSPQKRWYAPPLHGNVAFLISPDLSWMTAITRHTAAGSLLGMIHPSGFPSPSFQWVTLFSDGCKTIFPIIEGKKMTEENDF